ncbi:hypothetical protein ACS0TY_035230 [Phlomoides rotata]
MTKSYQIILMLAREILASPTSTVVVEQIFSLRGYTLDAPRSNMVIENIENQCLFDDWVRAEKRAHNKKIDDDDDEESK